MIVPTGDATFRRAGVPQQRPIREKRPLNCVSLRHSCPSCAREGGEERAGRVVRAQRNSLSTDGSDESIPPHPPPLNCVSLRHLPHPMGKAFGVRQRFVGEMATRDGTRGERAIYRRNGAKRNGACGNARRHLCNEVEAEWKRRPRRPAAETGRQPFRQPAVATSPYTGEARTLTACRNGSHPPAALQRAKVRASIGFPLRGSSAAGGDEVFRAANALRSSDHPRKASRFSARPPHPAR